MAARAAASRLAAAFSASRAARTGSKLLATGSGAYGLYKAGEHAVTETVPYAAAVDGSGGGRRRFAPPPWLASMLPKEYQPVSLTDTAHTLRACCRQASLTHLPLHPPRCRRRTWKQSRLCHLYCRAR